MDQQEKSITNSFERSFMCHEIPEVKIQRTGKTVCFINGYAEVGLIKGSDVMLINGGCLARLVHSDSFVCPCIFRDKDASSLGIEKEPIT